MDENKENEYFQDPDIDLQENVDEEDNEGEGEDEEGVIDLGEIDDDAGQEDDDDDPDDDDDDQEVNPEEENEEAQNGNENEATGNNKQKSNTAQNYYIDIEDKIDDEELEEDMFRKFDDERRDNYLKIVHPEENYKSSDEINKLTHINYDNKGFIKDPLHKTYPILSKYEYTRVIGLRISQLSTGSQPFIEIKNFKILDNHIIAEKELEEKKLPFIILRPMPDGSCEYWKLKDLEIIKY